MSPINSYGLCNNDYALLPRTRARDGLQHRDGAGGRGAGHVHVGDETVHRYEDV